jgi:hypothetical protein
MKTLQQILLRANALYLGAATNGLLADVLGIFFAQGPHSRMIATAHVGVGLWRCARSWRLTTTCGAPPLRRHSVHEPTRLLNHDRSSVMTRIAVTLFSLFTIAALAAGCASAPSVPAHSASTTGPDCRQLSAEIAQTEQAKRAALEKQRGAWKTIVPFVVAARYVSAKSAVEQADQRLGELHSQFNVQGCDRYGNSQS